MFQQKSECNSPVEKATQMSWQRVSHHIWYSHYHLTDRSVQWQTHDTQKPKQKCIINFNLTYITGLTVSICCMRL